MSRIALIGSLDTLSSELSEKLHDRGVSCLLLKNLDQDYKSHPFLGEIIEKESFDLEFVRSLITDKNIEAFVFLSPQPEGDLLKFYVTSIERPLMVLKSFKELFSLEKEKRPIHLIQSQANPSPLAQIMADCRKAYQWPGHHYEDPEIFIQDFLKQGSGL